MLGSELLFGWVFTYVGGLAGAWHGDLLYSRGPARFAGRCNCRRILAEVLRDGAYFFGCNGFGMISLVRGWRGNSFSSVLRIFLYVDAWRGRASHTAHRPFSTCSMAYSIP